MQLGFLKQAINEYLSKWEDQGTKLEDCTHLFLHLFQPLSVDLAGLVGEFMKCIFCIVDPPGAQYDDLKFSISSLELGGGDNVLLRPFRVFAPGQQWLAAAQKYVASFDKYGTIGEKKQELDKSLADLQDNLPDACRAALAGNDLVGVDASLTDLHAAFQGSLSQLKTVQVELLELAKEFAQDELCCKAVAARYAGPSLEMMFASLSKSYGSFVNVACYAWTKTTLKDLMASLMPLHDKKKATARLVESSTIKKVIGEAARELKTCLSSSFVGLGFSSVGNGLGDVAAELARIGPAIKFINETFIGKVALGMAFFVDKNVCDVRKLVPPKGSLEKLSGWLLAFQERRQKQT